MVYNKARECMDREELLKLQSTLLVKEVKYAYENSPLYKKKFDQIGLKPEDIKGLEDIKFIPFTTKDDFRNNYPFGTFAAPKENIVRLHASSGTTGQPVVVGYTENDLEMWSECVARALSAGGMTKNDVFHVTYGYGLFTGGLGLHGGSQKIGCTTVPMSTGNTKKQIRLMVDFGAKGICCTPSYILQIAETARDLGIEPKDLPIKSAFLGAEPWTEAMRTEIQEILDIKAFNIFGLTEILGPGVAYDCDCRNGMHINEDNFIAEILDPKTFEPLPDGEVGELVFTTLTKEGVPNLRYRTKDLASISNEPCACGRTFRKLNRIVGRSDDMLIIRGVNVFPSQIEEVLLKFEGVEPNYLIVLDRENSVSDHFEIWVEVNENILNDEMGALEDLKNKILGELHSIIGLRPKIKLVEPYTIERCEGKVKRVIDKRDLYK